MFLHLAFVWNEPLCVVRNIVVAYLNIDVCNINAMIIFTILNWGVGVISYYLIEKTINGYIQKLKRAIRVIYARKNS